MSLPLKQYGNLLVAYLHRQRVAVALLAVLLVGGIGLQLASPQVLRLFLDTATGEQAGMNLLPLALVFVALALVQRVLALGAVYVGENVGWRATNALRSDLTRHCLRLDMGFHKQHTPGELIERIDGDITALANFFSQFIIRVLGNALLVAGVLLLLFREDWRVGAGLSAYALITLFALGAIQRLAVRRWEASRAASADQYGFLEERMNGTEDIRANGGEPYALFRLYGLLRRSLLAERAARLLSNLTFVSTNLLFVIGYALGLAIGALLYVQGQITIGTAYMFVFYIGMLAQPLDEIRTQVQDLQQAGASIHRVDTLFRTPVRVREDVRTSLPDGPLTVAFESVTFDYADQEADEPAQGGTHPPVLQEVSFALQPGEVLGLLGRTGSGKTTISRLLFRLYDPAQGAIRLGGTDIRSVALSDLRDRVGMVTQDVQLFQASIRDNLTFFNRSISDNRIEAALRELGLWAWVQGLPHGLETQLAAGGQGLSAGEAQLLAFARVFLKDPGLVILDEASSRLDPATERLLERAIDRLFTNRSAIIIAHRLRTVQRADQILVLDQGRVAEFGPRERLARDPQSHFYRLLQTGEEVLA